MGIKSTRTITREEAIDRIIKVNELIKEENYKAIENNCSEHESFDVASFVHNTEVKNVENFTKKMLENIMDYPGYRFSYFDNYTIED